MLNDSVKFIEKCKQLVSEYTVDNTDSPIDWEGPQDVYIVWYSKTLQNHKALLSTSISDGMYYECTYNGDKNEIYFDTYKKVKNIKVEV